MLKNVTLSIEENLLRMARAKATGQQKTLNELFRDWVRQYTGACSTRSKDYMVLMKKMQGVHPGKRFSRDEMNER